MRPRFTNTKKKDEPAVGLSRSEMSTTTKKVEEEKKSI